MKTIKLVAGVAFLLCSWTAMGILAVDALEFEASGDCQDCLVLGNAIRPELKRAPLIARADCAEVTAGKYRFCAGREDQP